MRWNNNPADVSAGFPIYEPGDYELKVKEVRPFMNKQKTGTNGEALPITGGVRAICSIEAGEHRGKPYVANLYVHSDEAWAFSKQFVMAVYGFPVSPEKQEEFNRIASGMDWHVDVDNNSVGDGFQGLVGKLVTATLDIKKDQNGNPQQSAKYRPV